MLASLSQSLASYAAVKNGDQSVLNSVTQTNATGLAVPIGAGETWIISWICQFNFSAAGGAKIAITTPAGAAQTFFASAIRNGGSAPVIAGTATSGTDMILSASVAVSCFAYIDATVINSSTAGSVTLQFAQNALDGVTPTVLGTRSQVSARKI